MFSRLKDESKTDFIKRFSESKAMIAIHGASVLDVAKKAADYEFSRIEIGKDIDSIQYVKSVMEIVDQDEDKREITFVASTSVTDRGGDIIVQDGWRFDMPTAAIPFMWAHDYSKPPIGKIIGALLKDGKLLIKVHFIEPEIYPFGDMIYRMYKAGYMNAVSVGFMPIKYEFMYEGENFVGVKFVEQTLTELSAVPVPANQEALIMAGLADFDREVFKKELGAVYRDVMNCSEILDNLELCSIIEVEDIRKRCDEKIKQYDDQVKADKGEIFGTVLKGVLENLKKK